MDARFPISEYPYLIDLPLTRMAFFQSFNFSFSPITENIFGVTISPSNRIHSWWIPGQMKRLIRRYAVKLPHDIGIFSSSSGCKVKDMMQGSFWIWANEKRRNIVISNTCSHWLSPYPEWSIRCGDPVERGSQQTFFVEGPRPQPFEFPRAPSKIWRVPPLKYITNSPILGGPLGPKAKFHKGPIGFSGAQGPCLQATESPVEPT